jgi:hypothetical protein
MTMERPKRPFSNIEIGAHDKGGYKSLEYWIY